MGHDARIIFPIWISSTATVAGLANAMTGEHPILFRDTDASSVALYHASIPTDDTQTLLSKLESVDLDSLLEMKPSALLSEYLQERPAPQFIHIIAKVASAGV
jgi:hypothetical protein